MHSFSDIQEANKTIKMTNIKGKSYAEVNQRIKAFRMLYPEGFIHTEIISHEDGIVVMRAEVGYEDKVLGTGTAFENKKFGMVNGTSYIENCETSAVGRALGMLGLGIEKSIASYEEVNSAISQAQIMETEPKKEVKDEVELLCESIASSGVTEAEFIDYLHHKDANLREDAISIRTLPPYYIKFIKDNKEKLVIAIKERRTNG